MKITDLELMLYADGELDQERARRVRVARLYQREVVTRLDGIERVGEFVRAWAKSEGADARAMRRRALRSVERRRGFAVAAVAMVALAAVAEPVGAPGLVAAGTHELASVTGPAVAIEAVDFGTHAGTVFVVESGDGQTPVVWLDDDVRAGG
jgi:hypothetical protein